MKKINKILAGICLCGVGVGALTGCSLTGDQQAAIDKLTNNVDKMVELVDKNNSTIGREDAIQLANMSINRFKCKNLNQIQLVYRGGIYKGVFNILENNFYQEFDYRNVDNISSIVIYMSENNMDSYTHITKSDFSKKEHYNYDNASNEKTKREYKPDDFYVDWMDILFFHISSDFISLENLVKVETLDNSYKLEFIIERQFKNPANPSEQEAYVSNTFNDNIKMEITFDGFLKHLNMDTIHSQVEVDGKTRTTNISSTRDDISLYYDDADFSKVDAEIAKVDAMEFSSNV